MKNFNDLADFDNDEINALLQLASRLDQHPEPEALRVRGQGGILRRP